MGIVQNKEDIYNLALSLIDSQSAEVAQSDSESYLPQNRAFQHLDLIIAKSVENFRFPFAFYVIPLSNPVQDPLLSKNAKGENRNLIYTLPPNFANLVGVYERDTIPSIYTLIDRWGGISSSSILSSVAGDKLIVPYPTQTDFDYYLVYVNSAPDVHLMSSTFQEYLVFELASSLYVGIGNYTNSNILRILKRDAQSKFEEAKIKVLQNSYIYRDTIPTMLDVAYYANKDGQV